MNVGTVIRKKREEAGLTQAALARRLGVSESTLRLYELGIKNVPHDVANVAAVALRSPEIVYAKCMECPANWLFSCLSGVDTHPVVEVQTAIEEAREAIEAVGALNLRNKSALSHEDRRAVEHAIDQLLDLVPMVAMAAASWCRTYGLDLKALHKRHVGKLASRGYLGEEAKAA